VKPARVIVAFALAVFVGGALAAPWLYWLARWAATLLPALRHLAESPFHRYVNRCLLVLALAGIWPLMRALGAASWREIGWVRPAGQWRRLASGVGFCFALLALVAGLAVVAGARDFRHDLEVGRMVSRVASATASAVAVALLEETFFRGTLLGGLRRAWSPIGALVLSSLIYAWVHFFERPPPPQTVEWHTGLVVLAQMCRGFLDVTALAPGFLTLALAGAILGLAFQRTGNLYFSVGLHAGWIFWLKLSGTLTSVPSQANSWFWGSGKLIDGWLAMGVMTVVLTLLMRFPVLASPSTHGASDDQPA
jgi:uncharacterized protein